ncbi:MAG TPA: hypothetical protein PK357_03085 [Candidatus Pacearchaeota archaeon]|nr:hypothetical protein [Candidatus Pacearchaeota archaeon]
MKENKSLKNEENEDSISEQRNTPVMHKIFYSSGKYDFHKLEDKWKLLSYVPQINDICHHETPLKNIYKKEIWDDEIRVYKDNRAITVIYSNPQTLLNKFEINLLNYSDDNLDIVRKTKSMLEEILGCELNDEDNDLMSNLDIEKN